MLSKEEVDMRSFTIGTSGVVSEGGLIETMQGYATLFTTLRPDDTEKAFQRFQQVHVQLKEHGLTDLTDELAEVVVKALEKIIDRDGVESRLEEPLLLLAKFGSTRATPFLLTIMKKEGDDEALLFKREMAAEKLVCIPDPTIPEELSKIARGRGQYSRSRRRVAVWALGELDDPQAKQTLVDLRGDDEVGDLIKTT